MLASGELTLDPAGGLPSFRPPHCPLLEKILRAPTVLVVVTVIPEEKNGVFFSEHIGQ